MEDWHGQLMCLTGGVYASIIGSIVLNIMYLCKKNWLGEGGHGV